MPRNSMAGGQPTMTVRSVAWTAAVLLAGISFYPLAASLAPPAHAAAQDEAAAARKAAEAIDSSGKPAEAEAAWRKVIALQQGRKKPDTETMAIAHNRIGDTLYYRGKPDLAQKELETARDMLAAAGLGESDTMSETLSNLGTMHTAQGRPNVDVDLQRRALAMRVKLHGPDDNRLAINYYNLGYALYELGQSFEAADNIERGTRMRLATMQPDNPDLFLTLATAAGIVEAAGRLNTSIEFAQKAVELVSRYHPKHPYAGFVRGVLGKTLTGAGRASEAVEVTRLALAELAASMGEDNPLTLDAVGNLAVSMARLGRFDEAQELTMRSIPKNREERAPDTVRALITASNYAGEGGREAEAIAVGEEAYALAVKRMPADHAIRGQAAFTLAMHLERSGQMARALELMRETAAIYAKREDAESPRRLSAEVYLGGLEIGNGMRDQGYARVMAAADRLAPGMFRVAQNPALGASNNSYYETFARAAEAAVQANRPADAFRFYQLASYDLNVQASQQVALRNAAGHGSDAAAHVRALQDAGRDLRALNSQKAALLARGNADGARQADAAIATTEARIAQLTKQLEVAVPGFGRFSRPEIVPLETLQARLAPGEGLLVAMPSRSRTTLMLVRRDGVRTAVSAKPRSAMRPLVAAVRGSVDVALSSGDAALPAFDFAASHSLYSALFPREIRGGTKGVSKLHVAATDALASLPFALLVTRPARGKGDAALRQANWLIRDMSLDVPVTMASIGASGGVRREGTAFAGIGAPALGGTPGKPIQLASLFRGGVANINAIRELPPLPGALAELGQMRAALGGDNSVLVTGADASEAAVKAMDLSRFSVLAFATHGLIANQVDGLEEPALVLTPPAAARDGEDGLLTVSEIAALRLNADWVILSACNTASGATQSAPSYTGLAHAFIYAGAQSLLLSHWQVRDDAASRLSVETVRGTASGMDRAEALRRAMLSLIADRKVSGGAHPAVWAPFILIGQ